MRVDVVMMIPNTANPIIDDNCKGNLVQNWVQLKIHPSRVWGFVAVRLHDYIYFTLLHFPKPFPHFFFIRVESYHTEVILTALMSRLH